MAKYDEEGRIHTKVHTGHALIGGDLHAWPGKRPTALRAFIEIAKEYKPQEIILNGDVIDAAKASRHQPIGWEEAPELSQELQAAEDDLVAIEKASPNSALRWPLGNHDARFETRLAGKVPEYANIKGVHLKDHFPDWDPCWAVMINGGQCLVKHRFKGGMHAARNNVIYSGASVVTGHTHRLTVTPVTYDGVTHYGVEHGMLAPVKGRQFVGYTESNPKDWRAGFVLLSWDKGRLLYPQVCMVVDEAKGLVDWQGKVRSV